MIKIMIAVSLGLFFLGAFLSPVVADDSSDEYVLADRVLVKKAERKLYLLQDGDVIRSYDIDLGANPVGRKRRRGDSRTPEGEYILDYKLLDSHYYMAIHISYPNEEDRQWAAARRWEAGGNVMIHGTPNGHRRPAELAGTDWTDGCIAVTNKAMSEIWDLVVTGTPILILP